MWWDTPLIPSLSEPKTDLHSESKPGLGYMRPSPSLGPYIVQETRNQEANMGVPRKQWPCNIGGLVNVQGTHLGLQVQMVGSYSSRAGLMRILFSRTAQSPAKS